MVIPHKMKGNSYETCEKKGAHWTFPLYKVNAMVVLLKKKEENFTKVCEREG